MDRDLIIANNDLATIIQIGNTDNNSIIDIIHLTYDIDILDAKTPVKIINYHKIDQYVRDGVFLYLDADGQECVAINDCKFLLNSNIPSNIQIKLIKTKDFYTLLEQNFSNLNIIRARYWLGFINKSLSAKNLNFLKIIVSFNLIFFLCLNKITIFFHIFNNISYFIQNILKIFLFYQATKINKNTLVKNNYNLPIYTILIPLYQEKAKLKSIINSINNLNYPKSKMDVKIIIEEDDIQLIEEIKFLNLPSYFHVIIVPFSLPRTKPKALNYAIIYAKGEYLTVYDAEDQPDSEQLLIAVQMFRTLPEKYACLQAKLNFYNANENLLTKFFSIEYCIWFEYLLKGLSILDLPVTLGGTSNHFKTNILRELGYWDAYNVTEDAELGIRLYCNGYKTCLIDSYTMEEAPIDVGTWINQRSRWIKGFIQTFIIFCINSRQNNKLTLSQKIVTYIFVGMSSYNFYCLPWLILTIIINQNTLTNYIWLINSFFTISYSYSTVLYIFRHSKYFKSTSRNKFWLLDYLELLLWPFYFVIHSIASYIAIWEIIRKPFSWNKTKHGISSQK